MVLLLDPIHIISFYHNEYDYLNDQLKALAMMNLHDDLAIIPEEILESISGIWVLNSWSAEYSITKKTKQFFFKLLKEFSQSKILIKLFKQAEYTDCYEFSDAKKIDLVTPFMQKIFFDNTLTKFTIQILTESFSKENTIGFRKVVKNKEIYWEKINEVEKYLNVAYSLVISPDSQFKPEDWTEDTIKKNLKVEEELVLEIINDKNSKLHVCVNKEDEYLFNNFILDLREKLGPFAIIECSSSGFNLLPDKERLIIKNIERLPSYKLTELYTEVLTGEYNKKIVIFHANKPMDLTNYPEFVGHFLFSPEKHLEILKLDAEFKSKRFKVIEKLATDLEIYIKRNLKSRAELGRELNKLKELTTITELFDAKKTNFWYDLNSISYPKAQELDEVLWEAYNRLLSHATTVTIPNKELFFTITHDVEKGKWLIFKNNEKIKQVSYQNSLGLKYLAYLVKHYSDGKTIEDKDLNKVVLEWHSKGNFIKKKNIKKDTIQKPAAHSIEQALHYLFLKQCPELTPLKRYTHITANEPGCWYEPNLFVECEVFDEQMPTKKD